MPQERWIALLALILGSLLVLGGGYNLYSTISETNALLEGPGTPQAPAIRTLLGDLDKARKERDELVVAVERHLQPYGLALPVGTLRRRLFEPSIEWEEIRPLLEAQSRIPPTGLPVGSSPGYALRMHLNHWAAMLNAAAGQNPFTYWAQGAPAGEILTFRRLFEAIRETHVRHLQAVQTRHAGAATDRQARTDALNQIRLDIGGRFRDLTADQGLIKQLRREIDALEQQRQANEEARRARVREREGREAERRRTAAEIDAARKVLQARVGSIEERIRRMRHERALAEDRQDPDGEILYADEERQIVFLDLSRRNRLFPQMRLEVFGIEGGVKVPKGTVEVYEIGDEVSRAAVVRREAGAPRIKAGDFVYNIHYERDRPLCIVLAGRFGLRFSREDLVEAIRANGDVWQAQIDGKTDLVVVGRGFAAEPAFQAARERGIRTISERALYAYLGLPQ